MVRGSLYSMFHVVCSGVRVLYFLVFTCIAPRILCISEPMRNRPLDVPDLSEDLPFSTSPLLSAAGGDSYGAETTLQ